MRSFTTIWRQRRSSRSRRRAANASTSVSARARTRMTQDEIAALLVRLGREGKCGMRLKGGGPVRLRTRRRRGARAARRRHTVRNRPGHHGGDRRTCVRRHTGNPSRPQHRGDPCHRTRRSVQGALDPGLGEAGRSAPNPRALHGDGESRADRRGTDRKRSFRRNPGRGHPRRHQAHAANAHRNARDDRRTRARSPPFRAGDRGGRRGWCVCAR